MKSVKFLLTCLTLVLCTMTSHAENQSAETSAGEDHAASLATNIDIGGIMAFKSKDGTKLTEKDYDFLLDQLEIIVNKVSALPADQVRNYIKKLGKDEGNAVMIVALILGTTDRSKFTDKQRKRFEDLEKRDPTKR